MLATTYAYAFCSQQMSIEALSQAPAIDYACQPAIERQPLFDISASFREKPLDYFATRRIAPSSGMILIHRRATPILLMDTGTVASAPPRSFPRAARLHYGRRALAVITATTTSLAFFFLHAAHATSRAFISQHIRSTMSSNVTMTRAAMGMTDKMGTAAEVHATRPARRAAQRAGRRQLRDTVSFTIYASRP